MSRQQVFVRKKEEFDVVSTSLFEKLKNALHITVAGTVYYLYEVEGLDEKQIEVFQNEILGDRITDIISSSIDTGGRSVLAYTSLAGHFDQRAYYALQSGKLVLEDAGDFSVHSSTVIVFDQIYDDQTLKRIETYLINPVDTRIRTLEFEQNATPSMKKSADVSLLRFMNDEELGVLKDSLSLTMDVPTLAYIRDYYRLKGKEATETELFLFDTYWSDHCRHTTFLTHLKNIEFTGKYAKQIEASFRKYIAQREEIGRSKEVTLMDLATHSQRYLKSRGLLERVEQSQEINACSIYTSDENGEYLLMFKNETHNHPTEIEPFGGAQTCLGGAIRDPLSGRSFVFQGVRITGAADVLQEVGDTLENKLPQSVISKEAARGFSSYGNQIGMATTLVREIYHPSYVAKRMELGAVVGITKKDEVVRKEPSAGDLIFLLGGRTGKDGIGGASGSSVSHTSESLDTSYAQIQKGNPLEERKLQRLFRIPEVKRIIKRCNDFGAGGVSVAIGELADGIEIDLDKVVLKTQGMNATEIAISESQERMAVVIDSKDASTLIEYAEKENVEASRVAVVTEKAKLVMIFKGKTVVEIDRSFLDTNGLLPSQEVTVTDYNFTDYDREKYSALNSYSQKGLQEIFDSSVGYSTLFSPYGGTTESTPELSSVQRFPLDAHTSKASVVSYGFDPTFSEDSPYKMGMCSVLSSVAKQIATGAHLKDIYLSFQEYFPKPGTDRRRWGLVLQALLGAFEVCDALNLAAIGGKDSMSGTYENLDVIPTLVSFAFGEVSISNLRSRAFKSENEYIYVLKQKMIAGLPDIESFKDNIAMIERYRDSITSISTLDEGLSHTLDLMSLGNEIGYLCDHADCEKNPGGFVFTSKELLEDIEPVGRTTGSFDPSFREYHLKGLKNIFPFVESQTDIENCPPHRIEKRYYHTKVTCPVALIVTFSGTNSELDMEMNFTEAGAETRVFVVNDTGHDMFKKSVDAFTDELKSAHILVFPGGFSFSDEPDGSGKYIASFLKTPRVSNAIEQFLDEDKLILGICNGFQGLIKSGLLPYGKIRNRDEKDPTLFFNDSFHHVAKLVKTKIRSTRSPWLQDLIEESPYILPVSHSEGKFIATEQMQKYLEENDLIATVYEDNPNGSVLNIEGIISPNGNILGKMAHNERISEQLFVNVEGNRRQDIFKSGVRYFTDGGKR
ncbi:MAG: phosphoribosylformylglycinamidine synthase [Spirochaetaceae bacterium JB067]